MAVGDPTLYKGYLGGHDWVTHTDEGALKFAQEELGVTTMLDVGCGPGGQVRTALSLGIDAQGVDGDVRVIAEADDIVINECDFTKETFRKEVDFIWSVEFVEHVKEEYQENYMNTYAGAKYVFITFAPPGKGGNHHVNLKPAQYWIDTFAKYGLEYSEELTNKLKSASTMKREFVKNNGLLFIKK